ncbi:MAG: hypothetical protein JWM10_2890 [Myxococcaceae bacterium]|nr:hypothetical protein [Myxococcaceae bacterium]
MKKAVALLRGINVGKAKRVAMADLRALVEGLGYVDARTLLNSGNVVFGVPAKAKGDPAKRIEEALAAKLGVSARVLVVAADELAAVVAADPVGAVAVDPSRYLVTFVAAGDGLAKAAAVAAQQDWSPDVLRVGERAVYTWCERGVLESPAAAALGKALRDGATSRNWATVVKLAAMLA